MVPCAGDLWKSQLDADRDRKYQHYVNYEHVLLTPFRVIHETNYSLCSRHFY